MSNAIQTTYEGVRFRSRLEARWAAFFDVVGWPWQYEPTDLAGYIPDFILPLGWGGEAHPLLVEVKPRLYIQGLLPFADKIFASGWDADALIVGSALWEQSESGRALFGVITDARDASISVATSLHCDACNRLALAAADYLEVGSDGVVRQERARRWSRCRLCNDTGELSSGGHHVDGGVPHTTDAVAAWAEAGNLVQWKGRGA